MSNTFQLNYYSKIQADAEPVEQQASRCVSGPSSSGTFKALVVAETMEEAIAKAASIDFPANGYKLVYASRSTYDAVVT